MSRWTPLLAVLLLVPSSQAAIRRPRSSGTRHSAHVSMRKKLHTNDLIAEPGTVELDWSSLYSYTTGTFSMPSSVRFTPSGDALLWGRTEYSASFDSVDSYVASGLRSNQFSDRLTFAATSVLYGNDHFSFALAPQVTTLLRGDTGVRGGLTAIGRLDAGLHSMGASATYTAASHASDTNPAGTWDLGAGYGRKLRANGVWSRFTPHTNVVWERSTGFDGFTSAFAGIEYQATPRLAIDGSGQRLGLGSNNGNIDRQWTVGMTLNLGHGH